jgi:hypothetical protein
MTDDVIAKSMAEATIHAPLAAIDLTVWVFTLTDSEYQTCSKNHLAAAVTLTPEGKRMYFLHYEIPKTTAQFDLLDSGDRTTTDLDENWF